MITNKKTSLPSTDVRRITVHEAGHVVTAYACGWKLRGVEFHWHRGDVAGHSLIVDPGGPPRPFAKARILVATAGAAAERLVLGNFRPDGAKIDFKYAAKNARQLIRLGGPETVAGKLDPDIRGRFRPKGRAGEELEVIALGFAGADRILRAWQPALDAVATALEDGVHHAGDDWAELRIGGKAIVATILSTMRQSRAGRKVLAGEAMK